MPYNYLENADVLFLRNIVCEFGIISVLNELDRPDAPHRVWKLGNEQHGTEAKKSNYTQTKAELDPAGYSVLVNFADPMSVCV